MLQHEAGTVDAVDAAAAVADEDDAGGQNWPLANRAKSPVPEGGAVDANTPAEVEHIYGSCSCRFVSDADSIAQRLYL